MKGPKGQFTYKPSTWRVLGMIAGGTGITPMLQVVRAALKNPNDHTNINLIYANVNYEDILLKKELDELAEKHKERFRVYYVLNNPPEGWTGGVGFVSKAQVENYMPAANPHNDIKILLCGMLRRLNRVSAQPLILSCRPSVYDDGNEVSHEFSSHGSLTDPLQKTSPGAAVPGSADSEQVGRSGTYRVNSYSVCATNPNAGIPLLSGLFGLWGHLGIELFNTRA